MMVVASATIIVSLATKVNVACNDRVFSLTDFLPYQLAVLSERVSHRLAVDYGRSHGLTVPEWRVLVHLSDRAKPVSVREITEAVALGKPSVSRAVTRLVSAGLVSKHPSQGDNRLVDIALTKDGRIALDAILPRALEVEHRLRGALSDSEQETLAALMEKLHHILDADPRAKPRRSV